MAYMNLGLPPSAPAGGDYEIRFIPFGGSNVSASLGLALVDTLHGANSGTSGDMRIVSASLQAGQNISQQNMPVVPQGIVYDSIRRIPVSGVSLRLLNIDGTDAPASCLPVDSNQQGQVTHKSGFYRFDILSAAAGCSATEFLIGVTVPASGFTAAPSVVIPPGRGVATQININACGGSGDDTIPATASVCDIQYRAIQPGVDVPVRTDSQVAIADDATAQGTTYYLSLRVTSSREIAFNNHIPVDAVLADVIAITKTSPLVNVVRGQLVPYSITMINKIDAPLVDLNLIDSFPPGFKYIANSARIDGVAVEPDAVGLQLIWPDLTLNEIMVAKMLLVVGSGVGEGEYINRAQVINNRTLSNMSGEASATVRVVPDPTFDCSDVIGKIFDDKNLNGYLDEGEEGIPGVRVVTTNGLQVTADAYGRFHITCAVVPDENRGSNFILKLDERSLPTGYRITTENPRVQKATRGKMIKFNFGATIHRVVRLDMADAVFEENSTKVRPQWISRIDLLIEQLKQDKSILRLSYLADIEDEALVVKRVESFKDKISDRWHRLDCCYKLMIETEVFWRRGAPASRDGEF
jgi:large repetitive protein